MTQTTNRHLYWISGNYTTLERVSRTFGLRLPKILEGNILDIGCSRGHTTRELALLYESCNVLGIDISKPIIREAKKMTDRELYPNLEFRVADGYTASLPQQFDAVFCMNNILPAYQKMKHYGSNGALEKFRIGLRNIKSMIKPGGYFLFSFEKDSCIAQMSPDKKLSAHSIYFNQEQYEQLINEILQI